MTHLYDDDEPETPIERTIREKREFESNKKYWIEKFSEEELKVELQLRKDKAKALTLQQEKTKQTEIAQAKAVLKKYKIIE